MKLAILILATLIRGWVLSKLWLWFIVSTFHVSPLGVAQCIGLSLIVSYLTHENAHHEDSRDALEKYVSAITEMLINPIVTILIALVVRAYL